MLSLHQKIEEYADASADMLQNGARSNELIYPPDGGLNQAERESLSILINNPVLKSALRKVLADNAAGILFELLNLVDGTTDPSASIGEWSGVMLVDTTDAPDLGDTMLHDEFFSTYLEWKEMRPNKSWTLDQLE